MNGKNIRMKRIEAGLTQQDLAKKSGLTYVAISNIENDKVKPFALTLAKLAKALELPVDFFLD